MGFDLKKLVSVCFLILLIRTGGLKGQLLNDSTAISLIRTGITSIYNLRFDEAQSIYNDIRKLYRGHPVEYLYHGIMTYWQNYPLLPESPQRNIFEDAMKKCILISEKKPYSRDYEAESVLANLCARGLLLLFYADNNMSVNVIPVATSTYKYIMRSFDFYTVHSDLFYFTGLYNYYRDAYPKFHPVYKPVAALFPKGNMMTGLNELNRAARDAIILRAEANSILSWIYTYYENNYEISEGYTHVLCEDYPANPYFRALHLKNLMLMNKYDEAEAFMEPSPDIPDNRFYNAQIMVFKGLLQEKKYRNLQLAQQYYEKGLNDLVFYGKFGNEFSAYAWFGMTRIYESSGNKAEARKCHRKAIELADFREVNFD